jgi:hypothetical protein
VPTAHSLVSRVAVASTQETGGSGVEGDGDLMEFSEKYMRGSQSFLRATLRISLCFGAVATISHRVPPAGFVL